MVEGKCADYRDVTALTREVIFAYTTEVANAAKLLDVERQESPRVYAKPMEVVCDATPKTAQMPHSVVDTVVDMAGVCDVRWMDARSTLKRKVCAQCMVVSLYARLVDANAKVVSRDFAHDTVRLQNASKRDVPV